MLISIDPGVHLAGIAAWHGSELAHARLIREPFSLGLSLLLVDAGARVGEIELAIEIPQVYARGRVDPNDLIALAFSAGRLAGMIGCPVTEYTPATWKKQVPKEIMVKRIQRELTDAETARVELAGALSHNIFDAVGVGLYHLKRIR